jgi:hypothetical protein
MGFPTSKHIRAFVRGKVVQDIGSDNDGTVCIVFTDGEVLRLQTLADRPERPRVQVIATPLKAGGEVKQCTEIDGWQAEK